MKKQFMDRLSARTGLETIAQEPFVPTVEQAKIHQGWLTSTQVNFCARSYQAVAQDHEDAAAFTVLGGYLRNSFLHTMIREKGGAYGGGAGYDSDNGAFRYFSYRDPRLEETLDDFDASLEWLNNGEHEARMLEEAILGVISSLDRPRSPAGEAVNAYYSELNGRTPEQRRRYRKRILDVSLEDLRRVANKWLTSEKANTAVITDPGKRELIESINLEAEVV